MRPNLTSNQYGLEYEEINGERYVRFLLAQRYMTWKKEDATLTKPTAYESRNVASFYRWHIYSADDIEQITEYSDLTTNEARAAKAAELNTLGANKAYLLLRADLLPYPLWWDSSSAKPRYIGIEGESDMEDITEGTTDSGQRTAIYDLQGRRVSDSSVPTKGIYIKDGKKVWMK